MKEQLGNINVTNDYKFDNVNIGEWLKCQRSSYLQNKLSKDKILKLENLGIEWTKQDYDDLWDNYYQLAKEYYKKNGDLMMKRSYKINGINLGGWILTQRRNYRENKMNNYRKEMLEEIGMVWNKHEATWDRMYIEAKSFYERHGHLSVPAKFVTENGLNLGTWITTQRKSKKGYGNTIITEEQIRKLDEIEMIWDLNNSAHKTSFNEQAIYYYLKKYTKHSIINRYIDLGFELDIYIPEIKFAIEYDGNLHKEREKSDIEKNNKCIENGIKLLRIREKLCNYEFDNCICINLNDYSNEQLEEAIYEIFQLLNINISRTLININADNDEITKQFYTYTDLLWEEWYELAKEYYNKNGNLLIERSYKTENGRNLGEWICRQRRAKKSSQYLLNEEQIKKLDSIGMIWGVRDANWNSYYNIAKKCYHKYGNINIPQDFVFDNIQIGAWISKQRTINRKGKLEENRKVKLEKLNIDWNPSEKIKNEWEQFYFSAKEYYEKYGNLKISHNYIDKDGRKLGLWIIRQRRALDPKSQYVITREQREKLDKIGMIWRIKDKNV